MSGVAVFLALLIAGNDYVSARSRQQTSAPRPQTGQTAAPPAQGRSTDQSHLPGGSPGPRPRPADWKPWWQDDVIKKEIGLTPDQTQKIQQIWESTRPDLDAYYQELDKQRKELDRLMSVDVRANIETVMLQIDKVEAQQSMLDKKRTIMLYKMHRILTRDQDVKLKAITDQQRDRVRRGGPPKN